VYLLSQTLLMPFVRLSACFVVLGGGWREGREYGNVVCRFI
jgi:hypothetical protein